MAEQFTTGMCFHYDKAGPEGHASTGAGPVTTPIICLFRLARQWGTDYRTFGNLLEGPAGRIIPG